MTVPAVFVSGLKKAYGKRTVLALDDLSVPAREFFVLLGPSGSGKTTLLRSLAGLVRPDAGRIELFGDDVAGVAPHERGLGFVFQGLALWPHLSVRGNIALGLGRAVPDPAERRARIDETAEALGLADFLSRRPHDLSGGERQRVALARALVRRPRLLLMDEPFSDLDARLRRATARLVRMLHDRFGLTTILITHDRTDAHLLADRIGVMRAGRLVACGAPDELHAAPGSTFAAEFLTDAAILAARVEDGRAATALGTLPLEPDGAEGTGYIAVRPDEMSLAGPDDARRSVPGTVVACEFAGGPWRCRVALPDGEEVAVLTDRPREGGASVAVVPPAAPRALLEEDADA